MDQEIRCWCQSLGGQTDFADFIVGPDKDGVCLIEFADDGSPENRISTTKKRLN